MSHILDALQKVQEEKAAKLKQAAITGGVLLDAPAPGRRKKNNFLLVGAAIVIVLAVALIARQVINPSSRSNSHSPVAVPQQQPPPMQQSVVVPSPQLPQSIANPQPPPVASPSAAATPLPVTVPPPPSASSVPQAVQTVPQPPDDQDEEKLPSRRKTQRIKNSAPAAATPRTADTGVPALTVAPEGVKLTGIAWQDNKKMRRAVVNDVLAGEGAVIAGVKIVEIRQTSVKFEKGGTVYEVSLSR